jgi:hypothetical protein
LITALLIPLNTFLASRNGNDLGPELGAHIHAMTYIDRDLLVLGHDASARQDGTSWASASALNQQHSTAAVATIGSTLVLSGTDIVELEGPRGISPLTTAMPPIRALGGSGRTVYAVSVDGATGVSRDSGHTYEWVTPTGTNTHGTNTPVAGQLAVNPNRSSQVWGVGPDGTVWSTEDGGATWAMIDSPRPALAVATGGSKTGRLAVLTDRGIEVSLDNGQTWTDTKAPDALQALTVNSSGGMTAATTVESQVLTFAYRDGTWRALV